VRFPGWSSIATPCWHLSWLLHRFG